MLKIPQPQGPLTLKRKDKLKIGLVAMGHSPTFAIRF